MVAAEFIPQNNGVIFTTSSLNRNTSYYFRTKDSNSGCASPWVRAEAILHPLPSISQPKAFVGCATQGSIISVTFPFSLSDFKLHLLDATLNTIQISESVPHVFPLTLSDGTYTYYVRAENIQTGCTTLPVPWNIIIHSSPVAIPLQESRCGSGAITVNVNGESHLRAYLFADIQGQVAIQALAELPSAFQFSSISQTTQYFYQVENSQTGCRSNLAPIDIYIRPVPFIPSVPSLEEYCSGAQATLKVLTPFSGLTYQWQGPRGFTAQGTQILLSNLTPAQSGFYLVTARNEFGCVSPPGIFELRVWPMPPTPIPTFYNVFRQEVPLCVGQELNLSIRFFETYPEGTQFEWEGPANFREPSHPFPGVGVVSLLNAGIYRVRAIYNSCTTTYGQVEVPIYPKPETPLVLSNAPICLGGAPLELTIANANLQYTYAWMGPNVFLATGIHHVRENHIDNAGIYSVVATSSFGCVSDTARLEVRFTPKVTFDLLPPKVSLCEGELLQFQVSGLAGLRYHITGPSNWDTVTTFTTIRKGIATLADAGEYTIYAVAGNCTSEKNVIPITIRPLPPTPEIDGRNMICPGSNLKLNIISPQQNQVYLWQGPNGLNVQGQTLNLLNNQNVQEGEYSVVAIQNGCTSAPRVRYIQRVDALPAPQISGSIQICEGETIELIASGYDDAIYLWSGPASFAATGRVVNWQNAPLYSAGIYTVYALTAEGCTTLRSTYAVQVLPRPSKPTIEKTAPICVYESLRLSVFELPGLGYTWRGPLNWQATGPSVTLDTYTTAQSGVYQVVAHAQGCTSAPTFFPVIIKPKPAIVNFTSSAPHCLGHSVELWAQSDIGATYIWKGPNRFELATTEGRAVVPQLTTASSGMYSVQAVLNGCTSDVAQTFITAQPIARVSVSSNSVSICERQTLRLVATASMGTQLLWQGPNGFTSTGNIAQKVSISVHDAGVYSVTAIENGCTGQTQNIMVNVVAAPPALVLQSNGSRCLGQQLLLSATSVLPNSQVLWQGPNGFTASGSAISLFLTNHNQAGEYSAVQIVGQCTSNISIIPVSIVALPQQPLASSNAPLCSGQTLNLEASQDLPNARYLWNGPNNFISTQRLPSISNVQTQHAGTYSVRIILEGCTSQAASLVIAITATPPMPRASAPTSLCEGQNLTLQGQGSANVQQYAWSGPNAFHSTLLSPIIPNVTTAESGWYELVAIQGNCTSQASRVLVTVQPTPPAPIASAAATQLCTGQNLQLQANAVSRAVYTWVGPNGFISNQQNPVVQNVATSQSGRYDVYVTVDNCRSPVASVFIEVIARPSPPRITPSATTICQNASLHLVATSQSNVRYFWSGPGGWSVTTESNSVTVHTPATGTYSVVSFIQSCTSQVSTVNVEVIPSPEVQPMQSVHVCSGNSFATSFNVPSGYQYLWTGPNGFSTTTANFTLPAVQSFHAGQYSLRLMRQGCNFPYQDISLHIIERPTFSLSSNSPLCQGQALRMTATGASGVSYLWSGPRAWQDSVAQVVIENVTTSHAGIYSVVAYVKGCTSQVQTLSIRVSAAPTGLGLTNNTPICQGQTAILTASALEPGAHFTWQGPNNFSALGAQVSISNITSLHAGTYTVIASIGNCSSQAVTTISLLPAYQCVENCQEVQQFMVSSSDINNITLRWQPTPTAVCYVLQYGEERESVQNYNSILLPATTSSYILRNLQPGRNYVIRIKSNCSACQLSSGVFSPWQSITASTLGARNASTVNITDSLWKLMVYPNPNRGNFVLTFLEGSFGKSTYILCLLDLQGNVLLRKQITLEEEQLEIPIALDKELPTGMYVLDLLQVETAQRAKAHVVIH
ncbi:MAG: fibronectin type III domain-containing protein [Bacteroidia bacterium]|nr:fibronectin type III domain-containing protein [Bacteroidia bacterium]